MSGIFRPETGSKRLDFSGGGGDRKVEFLLGGALSIVILGAIALIVWPMFKSNKTEADGKRKFECVKCEYQFEVDTRSKDGKPVERPPVAMGEPPQKCPKCEGDAFPMVQCPECGTWYLPERFKHEETRGEVRPGVELPPTICPKCGADYFEALRKKRHKQ